MKVCAERDEHCENYAGSHEANSKSCNLRKRTFEKQKHKLSNSSWAKLGSNVSSWQINKAKSGLTTRVVHADVH